MELENPIVIFVFLEHLISDAVLNKFLAQKWGNCRKKGIFQGGWPSPICRWFFLALINSPLSICMVSVCVYIYCTFLVSPSVTALLLRGCFFRQSSSKSIEKWRFCPLWRLRPTERKGSFGRRLPSLFGLWFLLCTKTTALLRCNSKLVPNQQLSSDVIVNTLWSYPCNNIPNVILQVGSGKVGCTQTLLLPLRGREVVSYRFSAEEKTCLCMLQIPRNCPNAYLLESSRLSQVAVMMLLIWANVRGVETIWPISWHGKPRWFVIEASLSHATGSFAAMALSHSFCSIYCRSELNFQLVLLDSPGYEPRTCGLVNTIWVCSLLTWTPDGILHKIF